MKWKTFGAAMIMVPPMFAFAQEDMNVDCDNARSQIEMNYCAGQDFQKADKELNEVYRQTLKHQQALESQGEYYVGAADALKKAQRAWITFRDAHCDNVGFEAAGGTMQSMLITGCRTELTTGRTKQLRDIMQGLGN